MFRFFRFLSCFKKRTRPLIMHVDDSELIIETTKGMLKRLSCDVITASSGTECLSLAESKKPDLILMDAMMPVMDGFQATVALKQNPRTRLIPIIMLTGTDSVKDVDKAMLSGATDYLVKPIQIDRLRAKLEPHIKLMEAGQHG